MYRNSNINSARLYKKNGIVFCCVSEYCMIYEKETYSGHYSIWANTHTVLFHCIVQFYVACGDASLRLLVDLLHVI